jgi:hypothetical protein
VEGIHPAEALWDGAKLTKLLWWERGQQQAIDVHNPSRDRQHTVNVEGVQDALEIDGPKRQGQGQSWKSRSEVGLVNFLCRWRLLIIVLLVLLPWSFMTFMTYWVYLGIISLASC